MAKGKIKSAEVVKLNANKAEQSKNDKKNERSLAEAKLAEIEKQEIADCIAEYNASADVILKKYNCKIMVQGQFVGDQIKAGIAIVKNK